MLSNTRVGRTTGMHGSLRVMLCDILHSMQIAKSQSKRAPPIAKSRVWSAVFEATNMSVGESTGNFLIKHGGVRVVVGLTCSLSIIGSVLIILSYVCFKNMRSRAREILMHISLMDLGVGLANLIGDAVSFDRYYKHDDINVTMTGVVLNISVEPYIDRLCRTQAFFAVYFTYGSVLWTISLAVYLYFLIIHHGTQTALYFIRFAYVFSYSMPLVMALWLMLTKRLGYAPYNSSGWCALIMTDPATKQHHLLTAIFGYDMWIYLAIVLVPTLYITVRVYIHDQVCKVHDNVVRHTLLLAQCACSCAS